MKSNTERPSAADPVPDAIQTLPDPTQKWKFISNLHPLSIGKSFSTREHFILNALAPSLKLDMKQKNCLSV